MHAGQLSSGDSRGFTLIEALVVLAVVGLTAALSYPQLDRALSGFQSRQARSEVVAGVLGARSLAVKADRPVALSVDRTGTSLSIDNQPPRTLPGAARIDGHPKPLWFYPDGSADGGSLILVTRTGTTTYLVSRALGELSEQPGRSTAAPAGASIGSGGNV